MDDRRFDLLAQRLAAGLDRRTLTAALGAALAGVGVAAAGEAAGAKGKGRRGRGKHGGHRDHGGGGDQRGGGAAGGDAVAPAKKKKCKNGTTKCGKKCRNLTSDPANCGACGHACGSGEGCVGGACAGGCGAGQTRCGGSCVNTQTDGANCGSCGHACGGGETCVGGSCGVSCGSGLQYCAVSGTCISSAGHPCCRNEDCGPLGQSSFGWQCNTTTHQCTCKVERFGVCRVNADGGALCGDCCPGAAPCPGNKQCVQYDGLLYPLCDCPGGTKQCNGSTLSSYCYVDWVTNSNPEDPDRCGPNCDVCRADQKEACCDGLCRRPCRYNDTACFYPGNQPCPTNNCTACGFDTAGSARACCENGCQNGSTCVP